MAKGTKCFAPYWQGYQTFTLLGIIFLRFGYVDILTTSKKTVLLTCLLNLKGNRRI